MNVAAGYYGKVASHGNFVSRRLPSEFVRAWDQWLQEGLLSLKAVRGAAWLESYLQSPLWRFALSPGLCGCFPWIGVFMPSVDRVGRYFPFTLAMEVEPDIPPSELCGAAFDTWFDSVERIALRSFANDHDLIELEAALSELAWPRDITREKGAFSNAWYWSRQPEFMRQAKCVTEPSARGIKQNLFSAWWTGGGAAAAVWHDGALTELFAKLAE